MQRRDVATVATLVVATLCASLGGSAAAARDVVLGRSLDGREIRAVEVGDPRGIPVLVVGCVHGNECAGLSIAAKLERASPRGVDLWIVPDLNPDGHIAGVRGNARGVDLNRNFPWRWRRMHGFYESGARPLSEPEARIAYRLILRLRPRISIWFHQHMDLVWASGGDRSVERRFARLSGLPYHALPPLAGSAISWQNHALPGTTAFAAELPAGALTASSTARYTRAVLAVAHGLPTRAGRRVAGSPPSFACARRSRCNTPLGPRARPLGALGTAGRRGRLVRGQATFRRIELPWAGLARTAAEFS